MLLSKKTPLCFACSHSSRKHECTESDEITHGVNNVATTVRFEDPYNSEDTLPRRASCLPPSSPDDDSIHIYICIYILICVGWVGG